MTKKNQTNDKKKNPKETQETESQENTKTPENTLSPKELREKMLEERKQKILASRKVKDSTFTNYNNN